MLSNKIDFAAIITVKNANPNGDPLNGNRPRVNYEGYGELSDVSIKRKIRNRLMDAGKSVFVQPDEERLDEYRSLRTRAEAKLKDYFKDEKKFREEACKQWLDVRAFGQVFAYKDKNKEKGSGVSVGVRGPVSIHPAFSVDPISISSVQLTKSVNNEDEDQKKASDTMGMKHRVDFGVYLLFGSMNPQLASKTGFDDRDAEAIKKALTHLFDNDASSARPEGSMEVYRMYWWKHNSPNGQYSSAEVHNTLKLSLKPGLNEPRSIDSYDIVVENLNNLSPEIIERSKIIQEGK